MFDAVDAASHISGNYGTISLKLWENKYFPLRYLPFQRALFIVLNPDMANNSLFLLRVRTSVAPGRPLRVVSREEPARQVKGLKANHENVICCSVGDIVALSRLARIDAHRADP